MKIYSIVFTYGDFKLSNIMVNDGDDLVVLGWGYAGWIPE